MHSGTNSTAALLRNSIDTVNGYTSNGIEVFETNIKSAIENWLSWNPQVSADGTLAGIKTACGNLAVYLLKAGLVPKADKVLALKEAAVDAVDDFQNRFRER